MKLTTVQRIKTGVVFTHSGLIKGRDGKCYPAKKVRQGQRFVHFGDHSLDVETRKECILHPKDLVHVEM